MSTQQHAILVRHTAGNTQGLSDLNVRLQRGWRVVQVSPLGGSLLQGDGCLAALVIVERETESQAATVAAEEETEEVVEELTDANGSGPELPGELGESNGGSEPPLSE